MRANEIIQKTLDIYSGDRNNIARYLQDYTSAESKYELLCKELLCQIDVPMLATGGISETNLHHLRHSLDFDEDMIFDSSDYYQFVLNEEFLEVKDWDFASRIEAGETVRLCRLFINNCIPVYHLHIQMIGNNLDKYLSSYNDYSQDIKMIGCIEKILHNKYFCRCPNRILSNRYKELKTDLVEHNASIYECLFSDFHLLHDDLESKILFL